MLVGQKVTNVHFANLAHYIGIGIALEGGEVFACQKLGLDVDVLREHHGDVLDSDHDIDYPERKES